MSRETKEKLVCWASESTLGTDAVGATPTAFHATIEATIMDRRIAIKDESDRGSASPGKSDTLPSHNEVTLESYLYGKAAAAGDAPLCDAIFKAAGLKGTAVASTSYTYTPYTDTDDQTVCPTATVKIWERMTDGDWVLMLATAVQGNLTISGEVGQRARWKFDGKGRYTRRGVPSSSAPSLPSSYSGGKEGLVVLGITLTVAATTFAARTFELSTNWEQEESREMTATTGLDRLHLRRAKGNAAQLTLTFHKAADLVAVLAKQDDVGPDTPVVVAIVLSDGTDTFALNIPVGVFGDYTRQGGTLIEYGVPIDCAGDYDGASEVGDNEFALVYT